MSLLDKVLFNARHLAAQPRPMRAVCAWLLAKSAAARRLSFSRRGFRLRFRPTGLARQLWEDPDKRLDVELFFAQRVREGQTVVDVGANIGILSLAASWLAGPQGRVIAIEAHPKTYEALLDNLRLNGITNVESVNLAVGAAPGSVHFTDRLDDDWNRVDERSGAIEVPMQTLDDVCGRLERIDLLKIDVEGYELQVLRGAAATLEKTCCVVLEFWAEHARGFGYGSDELLSFMSEHGFQAYRLEEEQAVRLTPLPQGHRPVQLENWVFSR
jgi:FkbM family methyltransferase